MEVKDLISKKKINGFAEYADKHDIFNIFHDMVQKLLTKQPIDPIEYMIEHLQQPQVPSIILHGITMSNVKVVGKILAGKLNCEHIIVSELIEEAIRTKSSLGIQAESYYNDRNFVPDNIVVSLIFKKIQEQKVAKRGWILQGYPKTREQALLMKRKGIIADSFIVLDIPDEVINKYVADMKYDCRASTPYHLKYNPPPSIINPNNLIDIPVEFLTRINKKMEIYNRNLNSIINCFKSVYRSYYYKDGIYGHEEEVANIIYNNLGQRPIIDNPSCLKIAIAGLPGSGKTFLSEFIAKKYGVIHVSVENVILEEISTNSELGFILKTYVNHYNKAPKDVVLDLIVRRLKKEDCEQNGWILDGYPTTQEEIDGLNRYDIYPNRLIYLNVPKETCISRLVNRRIDIKTGYRHNLMNLPPEIENIVQPSNNNNNNKEQNSISTLRQQECDKEKYVLERIEEMKDLKEILIKAYKYKNRVTNEGIMQDIEVDGIGEGLNPKCPSPSMNRAYDIIKGTLMRPVPFKISS
ncbi:P-loop containing nucleoside triphosphate hydrolase protein [Anaeromyces robustus]|uniref:p-loop containing nucleoside triphosphate hydrolase protein n=1 Tax=Anaeromyces robustus TaxID=1754192 RepID=A0A1Y1XJS7_9FUNG|nr:P-loop containing nucleoside triphosphate hydrolase protein [Anaeromyces robustus]|eukprot:ORX85975.1 P-loop containing nucleoside triphosphate hydrolase protein [Anaeromyces robustus]